MGQVERRDLRGQGAMKTGKARLCHLGDRNGDAFTVNQDGISHCLPSASQLPWGNTDFDVDRCVTNPAFDQTGRLLLGTGRATPRQNAAGTLR
jgi:hypothetical protein